MRERTGEAQVHTVARASKGGDEPLGWLRRPMRHLYSRSPRDGSHASELGVLAARGEHRCAARQSFTPKVCA